MAARRDKWRWSWSATNAYFRDQVWSSVVIAIAILVVAIVFWLWRQSEAADALMVNSLEALGLVVAASGVVLLWLLGWNYIRAADRLLIQRLSPGPQMVAAEQERVRNLRSRVVLIRAELAALRDEVMRYKTTGYYWDPYRERDPLPFMRLTESGGQLGEDPRTTQAYESCTTVQRDIERLRRLVGERWRMYDGFQYTNPNDVVYQPEIELGDDLDRTLEIIRNADLDLVDALRTLS